MPDRIETPEVPAAFGAVPRMRFWGDRKPPKNRADIFSTSVRAAVEGGGPAGAPEAAGSGKVATLRLYGPIDSWGGWWGISAGEVSAALDTLDDDIDEIRVRINSPGGEVWEGLTILNMLRARNARTVAVVDGLAASAASIIACGLDETVMSPGTQMMIHDASGFAYGPESVMVKAGSWLGSISNSIAEVYAESGGGTREDWRALMVEETWYTASEAVDSGLADRVGVVKDLGEAATAGDETEPTDPGDGSEIEDRFDLSIYNYAGRSAAPAPKQPVASAAGSTSPAAKAPRDTSQEGDAAVFTDEQLTTLRQKLGVSADANADAVLGALEEALDERAETPPPANIPEGHVVIPAAKLADLEAGAALATSTAASLHKQERDAFMDSQRGKYLPTSRAGWEAEYDRDPAAVRAHFENAPTLVPTAEVGHGQDTETDVSIDDAELEAFASSLGLNKEDLRG